MGGDSRGSGMDICTSSCYSFRSLPLASHINSPASACSGELLTHPFGSRCLSYAVSRWLGPPLRQTSIAEIRVGWLLKRFLKCCFANLLRDAVFLSCFHSICLSRGQREDHHVIGGYWCWLQIHFKLISTFLSQASDSHCISLDLDIALARLPVSEKNNFCTLNERKNKGNVLLHHVDCITCCFEFFPLCNIGSWVVTWIFQDRINCPVKLLGIPP